MLPAPRHLWFCCGTGPVRLHPLSSFGRRPNVFTVIWDFLKKRNATIQVLIILQLLNDFCQIFISCLSRLCTATPQDPHVITGFLLLWHRAFISRPRLAENWNASMWLLPNSCLVAPPAMVSQNVKQVLGPRIHASDCNFSPYLCECPSRQQVSYLLTMMLYLSGQNSHQIAKNE